jgi:hypothetical protein
MRVCGATLAEDVRPPNIWVLHEGWAALRRAFFRIESILRHPFKCARGENQLLLGARIGLAYKKFRFLRAPY